MDNDYWFGKAGGTDGATKTLRVMTYNIKGGEGAFGSSGSGRDFLALGRIVDAITAQQPDLVALQEIAVIGSREPIAHQVLHLAESLGMYAAFAPVEGGDLLSAGNLRGRDFWGNAVLSRYPILGSRVHELCAGRPRDCRCALETTIDVDSTPLLFTSVHLSYHWPVTLVQARELAGATFSRGYPCIVAGDFNAPAGSAQLSPIHAGLADAFSLVGVPFGNRERFTFPNGSGRERDLDHVFVSAEMRVAGCEVWVDEAGASDHNAVVARVAVPIRLKADAGSVAIAAPELEG